MGFYYIAQHYAQAPEDLCGGGLDLAPNWCSSAILPNATFARLPIFRMRLRQGESQAVGIAFINPLKPNEYCDLKGQKIPI